jgi:hypothetical protein
MERYQDTYKNFIKEYTETHSPFRLNDLVLVKSFGSHQEFAITKIVIDSEGDFNYQATSPRSHSTLPMLFKKENLVKVSEKV